MYFYLRISPWFLLAFGAFWLFVELFNRPPLTQRVVTRYGRRRGLVLTPTNADFLAHVIAHTRYWRFQCMILGGVAHTTILTTVGPGFALGFGGMLYGWLIGTIIAEWRLQVVSAPAASRVASLEERSLRGYVGPWMYRYILAFYGLMAVALVWGIVQILLGWARVGEGLDNVAILAFLLAIFRPTVGRITTRALANQTEELTQIDHAVRRQSVRTVTAATLALGSLCCFWAFIPTFLPAGQVRTWLMVSWIALSAVAVVASWLYGAKYQKMRPRLSAQRSSCPAANSSMNISVDTASPVPAFEQVRVQVETLILTGQLPPGFRLPSIRQLAQDLALAPGTVARVYKELESAQLIASRVRHGTVVLEPPRPTAQHYREQLAQAAAIYAGAAHRLGVGLAQAQQAVHQAWGQGVWSQEGAAPTAILDTGHHDGGGRASLP
jgi:GntR family transcriptional regulator